MSSFFESPLGFYITTAVLNILLSYAIYFIHKLTQKAEQKVTDIFPADEAQKINAVLNIVEQLTESAVQNANNQIVKSLKEHNLFTAETATALKKSVTNEIISNMGPLQEKATNLVGPLEHIVGNLIEKHVVLAKQKGLR